ncbi:MAG: DNA mismatch repair protein MutS, partial [Desulfobacterales bacterium]
MTKVAKLTPMLQQYIDIKEQHQDTILFYRMGDFYEMFFDDAIIASKILNITLTSRNKKTDEVQVPMCGVPYHAVQTYLSKLIQAGKRVAICEQVEDPSQAKGIVKRDVVRVVSPGVVVDDTLLDDKSNNYICSITAKEPSVNAAKTLFGISFLDVSTGHFLVGEFVEKDDNPEQVLDQLTRLSPSELLIADSENFSPSLLSLIKVFLPDLCITSRDEDCFLQENTQEILLEHFNVLNLNGFGCEIFTQGVIAAGALLGYVKETQKTSVDHIERLTPIETTATLQLDDASRRNLELIQTIAGAQRQGSLLSVLDHTCTPMGARMLKNNLLFPLQSRERIINRLDAVTYFYKNTAAREDLRELLQTVYDLERLNSRMTLGSGNGRDMLAMKNSLASLPDIQACLQACDTTKLLQIHKELDILEDLYQLLDSSINDEAPVTLREGNLLKEGYNEELDELVSILRDGKKLILDLENKEREATGIGKLKVGFNKVFGYFIEVSKLHSEKVPEYYIRKQTLVNAERFITPELKEFENKVLGAQDRRVELEYKLFTEIRTILAENSSRILKTA